jgi:hypothetical protein
MVDNAHDASWRCASSTMLAASPFLRLIFGTI